VNVELGQLAPQQFHPHNFQLVAAPSLPLQLPQQPLCVGYFDVILHDALEVATTNASADYLNAAYVAQ
jgi:hypothetical protein